MLEHLAHTDTRRAARFAADATPPGTAGGGSSDFAIPAGPTAPRPPRGGSAWSRVAWSLGALLCLPIALLSYRYLAGATEIPDGIANNAFRDPWLVIHAGAASTALLLGPMQLLGGLRTRFPVLHRWSGRLYAASCLMGGATGLVLAAGASTGWISSTGFGLLGVLWIVTTGQGWRTAVQRRFPRHRAWMIRSFALTFAAVTLRLYLLGAEALPMDADDSYRAIAWLCWVPNLLVAEIFLRSERTPPQRRTPSIAGAARTT